jgi:hypothetical protein
LGYASSSFFDLELLLFPWKMQSLFFFGWSLHVLMLNVIIVKKNTLWAQQVASFCFYFFFGYNLRVFYARCYYNGEKNILCTPLVTSHAHHLFIFSCSSLDQFSSFVMCIIINLEQPTMESANDENHNVISLAFNLDVNNVFITTMVFILIFFPFFCVSKLS